MGESSSVTINGVPATITRAQIVALIEALGIDPRELKRLEIGLNAVIATIGARGPNGMAYLDPIEANAVAKHRITIPIVDPVSDAQD